MFTKRHTPVTQELLFSNAAIYITAFEQPALVTMSALSGLQAACMPGPLGDGHRAAAGSGSSSSSAAMQRCMLIQLSC
jgi:hypothetical protein